MVVAIRAESSEAFKFRLLLFPEEPLEVVTTFNELFISLFA